MPNFLPLKAKLRSKYGLHGHILRLIKFGPATCSFFLCKITDFAVLRLEKCPTRALFEDKSGIKKTTRRETNSATVVTVAE